MPQTLSLENPFFQPPSRKLPQQSDTPELPRSTSPEARQIKTTLNQENKPRAALIIAALAMSIGEAHRAKDSRAPMHSTQRETQGGQGRRLRCGGAVQDSLGRKVLSGKPPSRCSTLARLAPGGSGRQGESRQRRASKSSSSSSGLASACRQIKSC